MGTSHLIGGDEVGCRDGREVGVELPRSQPDIACVEMETPTEDLLIMSSIKVLVFVARHDRVQDDWCRRPTESLVMG